MLGFTPISTYAISSIPTDAVVVGATPIYNSLPITLRIETDEIALEIGEVSGSFTKEEDNTIAM